MGLDHIRNEIAHMRNQISLLNVSTDPRCWKVSSTSFTSWFTAIQKKVEECWPVAQDAGHMRA
jgi:hypothetical protein